jgi:cytochrome c biogenesis protein CcdA
MESKEGLEHTMSVREKVFFVFGLLMALVYLSIGAALLLIPEFLADYHKIIKTGIGCVFIVYSFFRFYRTIKKYRSIDDEL